MIVSVSLIPRISSSLREASSIYVNRATVSGHGDVVFIRNYWRYNATSPVNRNIPWRRQLLYLPNLFAHHEHHPSERVPRPSRSALLSLALSLSPRVSFYSLFPPPRQVLYRLVGLISWHPIAQRRLASPRIRARHLPLPSHRTPPSPVPQRSLRECDFPRRANRTVLIHFYSLDKFSTVVFRHFSSAEA